MNTPQTKANAVSKPSLKQANLNNLKMQKAKHIALDAQRQRVSRNLTLAERSERVTVNCPISGITSLIDIPKIPQRVLIWASPLGDLANCRGIAQQGLDYLRKMDTQTLAGILLVLTNEYNLFRYQPADNAAQKNAVIRTAGKDCIINAILFVEEYVHSKNRTYLPQLSLILESAEVIGTIEGRMTEWLKLVASVVYSQDFPTVSDYLEGEDEFYDTVPNKTMRPVYVKEQKKKEKKEDWSKQNKKWAEQRELKADIKTAKEILKTIQQHETISSKILSLLKSVFTEDAILTIDPSMLFLIVSKMEVYTSSEAKTLVAILKKPYKLLKNEVDLLGDDCLDDVIESEQTELDLDDPEQQEIVISGYETIEEGEAIGNYQTANDSPNEIDSSLSESDPDYYVTASNEIDSRIPYTNSTETASTEQVKVMSFIDKIRAKKALEAAALSMKHQNN